MFDYRFEKIMQLKEREKEASETVYREAQRAFEQAGEKLYELLKKKETLLEAQEKELQSGFSVQNIQHYQHFIATLEKRIEEQQKQVIKERGRMQWQEQQLLEKNIEVKKYGKLKANELIRYKKKAADEETKQMDELSVQQFLKRKIR